MPGLSDEKTHHGNIQWQVSLPTGGEVSCGGWERVRTGQGEGDQRGGLGGREEEAAAESAAISGIPSRAKEANKTLFGSTPTQKWVLILVDPSGLHKG